MLVGELVMYDASLAILLYCPVYLFLCLSLCICVCLPLFSLSSPSLCPSSLFLSLPLSIHLLPFLLFKLHSPSFVPFSVFSPLCLLSRTIFPPSTTLRFYPILNCFVLYSSYRNEREKAVYFSQMDPKLSKGRAYFASESSSSNSNKIYLRDMPNYVSNVMSDSGLKFTEEYKVNRGFYICAQQFISHSKQY